VNLLCLSIMPFPGCIFPYICVPLLQFCDFAFEGTFFICVIFTIFLLQNVSANLIGHLDVGYLLHDPSTAIVIVI